MTAQAHTSPNTCAFSCGQCEVILELYLQHLYWNILMLVDVYLLAKHGEGVLRAWKMIGVLFVFLMGVEKFWGVKICLSV